MPPAIHLTPVERPQLGILHDLWQFYANEFSDVVAIEVGTDGRFEVDQDADWRVFCFDSGPRAHGPGGRRLNRIPRPG